MSTSDDAYRAGFLFAHERPEEPEVAQAMARVVR